MDFIRIGALRANALNRHCSDILRRRVCVELLLVRTALIGVAVAPFENRIDGTREGHGSVRFREGFWMGRYNDGGEGLRSDVHRADL
jgi:hypothetical protein